MVDLTSDEQAPEDRPKEWKKSALWGIFLLALAFRTTYLLQNLTNPLMRVPMLDEVYYIGLGKAIAGGFLAGERGVFFMDPLYGYFLGAVFFLFYQLSAVIGGFSGETVLIFVRLAQIVMDSAAVFLIHQLGVKVWDERAGLWAALFWALYKVAFFYTTLILKSTFSIFFALLFVLAFINVAERRRPGGWLWLGLLAGALTFIHANLLLMAPLGILAWALANRPSFREIAVSSVLLGAGLFTVLSIGAARNYYVAGEMVFLNSQSGRLLYASNNPENLTGRYQVPSFSRKGPEETEIDFHAEAERRLGARLSAKEASVYWRSEAVKFMIAQPADASLAVWNKLVGTFGNYEIPINRSFYMNRPFSFLTQAPLPNFALALGLGLPGLLVGLYLRRQVWWLAPPVVTVMATVLIFYTCSRFRIPMVPFLLVGAGIFAALMTDWIARRQWVRAGAMAAMALVIGGGSMTVAGPAYGGDGDFLLAKAYWSVGELGAARAVAQRAAREYPSEPRFLVILGLAALSENNFAEAERINRQALQIEPKEPDAMHNLGLALLGRGQYDEAAQWFRRAYAATHRPMSLMALARAMAAKGDKSAAISALREYIRVEKPGSPMLEQARERLKSMGATP